jgi:hypothetical protein
VKKCGGNNNWPVTLRPNKKYVLFRESDLPFFFTPYPKLLLFLLKPIKSWNGLKPLLRHVNNTWWPAIKNYYETCKSRVTTSHLDVADLWSVGCFHTSTNWDENMLYFNWRDQIFFSTQNRSLGKSKFDLSGVKIQR